MKRRLRRGEKRIVVELPGIKDPSRVKNLLGKTAQLNFRLVTDKENDFGSEEMISDGGEKVVVNKKIIMDFPFCNLIKFEKENNNNKERKVLIIAPMSGHYSTLVRNTVISLLPDCDVYVTDWKNGMASEKESKKSVK